MILAITGHRPNKLGGYIIPNPISNEVMIKLDESLKTLKPELVLTGMALGVDQWTAQICIDVGIPFEAIIAFDGYEKKWPVKSQEWYRYLLTKARRVMLLHPGPYSPSLLHQRNHWLVDQSDALLAAWDGLPGSGTAACVQYAQLKNPPKPCYRLNIPEYIWEMASAEESTIREKRAEWQSRQDRLNMLSAIKARPVKPPKAKPTNAIEFRRLVDVGEDD